MTNCIFEPRTDTSSATICKHCGQEKFLHIQLPQQEISDEEIEKEGRKRSWTFAFFLHDYEKGWVDAIKWYREQLKTKKD